MFSIFNHDEVPAKVLVCLRGGHESRPELRHRIAAALSPYAVRGIVAHQPMIARPAADCDPFATTADAHGPRGLHARTTAGGAAADLAIALHHNWIHAVLNTGIASPLRSYVDDAAAGDTLRDRVAAFERQPRVKAMLRAERNGTRFPRADYGPGLSAHQAGLNRYVPYFFDSALFGDALITVDGDLIAPTGDGGPHDVPILPRSWHTYLERIRYHQAARETLCEYGHDAVVVAVDVTLRSRPVRRQRVQIDHPFLGTVTLTTVDVPEAHDPTDLIVCPLLTAGLLGRPALAGTILGQVRVHGPRADAIALRDPADQRRGRRTHLGNHRNQGQAAAALLDHYLDQQR
ncbi:hypothetical protein AB0H43_13630 [Hamadaea sp. NPDC050747]|uniref:hypothetical protein n=1 Tax=Hamadaea sp. NPDC050747 TaxID=3155789 RepID=UPI0033FD966B